MRFPRALLLAIPLLALGLSHANDASACGGCFHEPAIQQSENTQVTGHKMILSVSKTQTTLWDQISYMGAPSSFAWVLPIKGIVDVGLSSDALFQSLEIATQVNISSPSIACNGPPFCGGSGTGSGATGGFGEGSGGGSAGPPPVTVIAQSVVGPYETVQLHSVDPAALTTWLTDHNFVIPADIKPIIDAYVGEGFDFLALKLVPGKAVTAMRPVRVTMPGGSPVLPLRMVAAGTGVTTPISLFVIAEGLYEPTNMPEFTISPAQLTWDWDTMSSNYAVLKKTTFDASNGKAWLTEAGEPFSPYYVQDSLTQLAQYDPVGSGYADDMGNGAPDAAQADLTTLFSTLDPASVWITRLHGELSRQALSKDLILGAAPLQIPVNRYLQAMKTKGTPPPCPVYPPCPDDSSGSSDPSGGSGGSGGFSPAFWDAWTNVDNGKKAGGGCAMTQEGGFSSTLGALSVLAALAFVRRRRGR
jgi:MYXO-CTERM domain-containing protein